MMENGHTHAQDFNTVSPINIIIWNIRGGNNEDFRRNFRELMMQHIPCVVTHLETRMQSHVSLLNEFEFSDMIEVPTDGQAGCMVILWDHAKVNVYNFIRRNHETHATIEVRPTKCIWLFSSIYASTNSTTRDEMWKNIKNISDNYKGPWLVGGDFNDVFKTNKKLGLVSIIKP